MLNLRRCVVGVAMVLAASGPAAAQDSLCPSGQELREERHDATGIIAFFTGEKPYDERSIKSRGCVGRNSENNYRRQGHWEFFHQNGQKHAEGSYVNGSPVWTGDGSSCSLTKRADSARTLSSVGRSARRCGCCCGVVRHPESGRSGAVRGESGWDFYRDIRSVLQR